MRIGGTVVEGDGDPLDVLAEGDEVVALQEEELVLHLQIRLNQSRQALHRDGAEKILRQPRDLPGDDGGDAVADAVGIAVRA